MALDRTGLGVSKRSEESKNKERRTGRSEGTGGGQPTVGHLSEESKAERKRVKRFSGAEPADSASLRRNPIGPEDVDAVAGAGTSRIGAQPITDGAEEEKE